MLIDRTTSIASSYVTQSITSSTAVVRTIDFSAAVSTTTVVVTIFVVVVSFVLHLQRGNWIASELLMLHATLHVVTVER